MVATQTDLENFHISPDLRKGTISVFRSPEDQLLHFTWKVRPSGEVEDVSGLLHALSKSWLSNLQMRFVPRIA